jgi:large subunit ribosomal protein L4e
VRKVKVKVYSIAGRAKGKIELPGVFEEAIRPDLIKRAVVAAQSARYQPQGVDEHAGKRTSAYSWGPGHGVSRVPRVKGVRHPAGGRAAFVPQAVGGRSAHPPRVEKKLRKLINQKEKLKALRSALAATARKELVLKRGHRAEKVPSIPLVVEDKLEALKTAKESKKALEKLKLWEDVLRAKEKKVRAGKGKMRGRRYKTKKSVLIVVGEDRGIARAARNLPGVDVVEAAKVGVEDLAPGTHYGRLTLYTKAAIKKIAARLGR